MTSLRHRVALVTGAGRARGIGAAAAEHLGRAGAAVVVSDPVPAGDGADDALADLEATAARVRQAGGRAVVIPLDVTAPEQVDAAVAAARSAFGGLDVVVNNAGASTAGLGAVAEYGAYTVTKHAVVGLTRLLAAELGPRGIRVNAVAPGMIYTDLGAAELELNATASGSSLEDTTRTTIQAIPVRRLGTPDDVAAAIVWLAQPGSYVSGTVLPVTGALPVGLN